MDPINDIVTFLNVAHLHLLMNHIPTVGTVIAVGLFVLSMARRSEHLLHASLEVFFGIALLALPVYVTGVAAAASIEGRPDVSMAAINAHHDAALLAFIVMEIAGLFAWLGLWQIRRIGRPSRATFVSMAVLSVLSLALMANAANIGGEIRHPEIKIDENAVAPAGWITAKGVEGFVNAQPWVWPAAETLHFMGLSVLFGVLFFINLRLMGGIRSIPFSALHRLLPWAMLAFGVNFVTGMLFFIAASTQYISNGPFFWKIIFLMLAGADLLYLTVFDKTWALQPDEEPPMREKVIAASAIGLWVGVIFWGRMLPFLGNSF
jgi:hypothetical protein